MSSDKGKEIESLVRMEVIGASGNKSFSSNYMDHYKSAPTR